MAKYTKDEVAHARTMLLSLCPPNTEVACVCTSVARSGMSRRIEFLVATEVTRFEGDPDREHKRLEVVPVTCYIACLLGYGYNNKGLRVDGCGMDMGFAVVNDLSAALYGHENRGAYKVSHRWM